MSDVVSCYYIIKTTPEIALRRLYPIRNVFWSATTHSKKKTIDIFKVPKFDCNVCDNFLSSDFISYAVLIVEKLFLFEWRSVQIFRLKILNSKLHISTRAMMARLLFTLGNLKTFLKSTCKFSCTYIFIY
jgi:hypothetical protein